MEFMISDNMASSQKILIRHILSAISGFLLYFIKKRPQKSNTADQGHLFLLISISIVAKFQPHAKFYYVDRIVIGHTEWAANKGHTTRNAFVSYWFLTRQYTRVTNWSSNIIQIWLPLWQKIFLVWISSLQIKLIDYNTTKELISPLRSFILKADLQNIHQ